MISLDAIAAGASLDTLTAEEVSSLLCLISAAQTRLAACIASFAKAQGDQLINADAAAEKLGVDRQWLYRRKHDLPFIVRLDGHVRYSKLGIERFIAAKRGAK